MNFLNNVLFGIFHSYIDHIFFTSNESLDKINEILDQVNNLHPNINLIFSWFYLYAKNLCVINLLNSL